MSGDRFQEKETGMLEKAVCGILLMSIAVPTGLVISGGLALYYSIRGEKHDSEASRDIARSFKPSICNCGSSKHYRGSGIIGKPSDELWEDSYAPKKDPKSSDPRVYGIGNSQMIRHIQKQKPIR